jgi:thiamine pyrophosphate-dependent acetolactate synthase large subunit-like protein
MVAFMARRRPCQGRLPHRRLTAPEEIQPGLADAFASVVPNVVELEIDPFVPKLL